MVRSSKHGLRAHSNALPQPMSEVCVSYARHYARRTRHCGTQATVWSTSIVVFYPRAQNWAQVSLRYRDQPVKALAAYRADHSFADRIRLRGSRWRFQHTQTQRLNRFIYVLREDAVSIVKQVAVGTVHTNNFSQLLHKRSSGWRIRSMTVLTRSVQSCAGWRA